jgi:predicted dienelactone hydrolase
MQFFETLFLIFLAVSLGILFKKVEARSRWMRLMPLFVLVLLVGQLFVSGFLWQLVPAYVVTILLALLTAPQIFSALINEPLRPSVGVNTQWLRLSGALFGFLLLAASVVSLLSFPVFNLPEPSGPFIVGTTKLYMNDKSRPEVFTQNPEDIRELMVKVWYPAEEKGVRPERYVEPEVAASFAENKGFPAFVSSHTVQVKTHRYAGVPMAEAKDQYPVLIFSHGLQAPVEFYSAFLEELASHGYIIFGVQHTYETAAVKFPDGRIAYDNMHALSVGDRWEKVWQINQDYMKSTDPAVQVDLIYEMNNLMPSSDRIRAWAEDIHFVLDELEQLNREEESKFFNRLDMDQLGGFGHSMGGAAIGQAMLLDSRIKAGANWDGTQWGDMIGNKLSQPFLGLDAVRDSSTYPFVFPNPTIYGEATIPQLSFLLLEGTGHSNFSDMAYLSPLKFITEAGPIDHGRCVELVNKLTLSFFNTHLRQQEGFMEELKQPEIRLSIQE